MIQPKFNVGDVVRIPVKTPGHDHHDPSAGYRVTRVYPGNSQATTHYELERLPSLWPETRLVG